MKKLLLISALALSITQANAAPLFSNAGLTNTVTFNEVAVAGGTAVTGQYLGQGVSFSTNGPGSWYSSGNTGPYSVGMGNFANTYLDTFSGNSGRASIYTMLFDNTVSAAGAWFEFNTSSPAATFSSYLGNVLQESFNYNNASCCGSAEFIGFTGNFNEIRISNITGTDFILDNLSFTSGNNVPEPGTLALLALGLLGLSSCAKRRQH